MKKMMLLTLLLFMLGGCAKWQNQNLVNPAERDKVLAKDIAYCNKLVSKAVPIGASTDGQPPEPTTYEANFSENYTSANVFERCMNDRGWTKK